MQDRILVVDDHPDGADSLVGLLRALNYDAKAVYTGQDAVEQVVAFHPDLAFIDIGMPDLDGYETLSRIRRHRGVASQMILVALTGHSRLEDKQRAYECGFDLHIAKPMSVDMLKEVLALLDPSAKRQLQIAQSLHVLGHSLSKGA